ncbi:MAG: ABC transporter permease [Chloroflexi bacterium]|nr:ABC transporter permease [Chloroflexota bacterium]
MIEEEARTGTLENVLVSSFVSFTPLFFFRIIARSIRSILETCLMGIVLTLVFRISLPISSTALLITLLTLVGVWGVGFALAGLAMIHKAVGSITSMVGNLAFLISGALLPLNALGLGFMILKYTFPMTWGIDILRAVILENENIVSLIQSGELPGLLLQTLVLIVGGLIVFNVALRRAKERGELHTY